MNIGFKINGVPVIGDIKIKGIIYYINVNKEIYVKENDNYVQVTDEATLRSILEYISPRSMDII